MCRITGIVHNGKVELEREHVQTMRDAMRHGGPDDAGEWIDPPFYLGHRRLSIIDLSQRAHQPMAFEHLVIVFNGEIYNYREIREELRTHGFHFQTDSDTEVLLKVFYHEGPACLNRLRGMFAFAVYDQKLQSLYLCRDRTGIKPLYWYHKDGYFMFSSELKGLMEHPCFSKSIDQSAVSIYLQQGYIPSNRSIFQNTHKLEPGSWLLFNQVKNETRITNYYSVSEHFNKSTTFQGSEGEAEDKLSDLIQSSLDYRLIADVPVGVFLSGGVDSSLIAAQVGRRTETPVSTFTIGFEDAKYDESIFAREVANSLGTKHFEYTCTEDDFSKMVSQFPDLYDEPFGDSSGIVTHLLSRFARNEVKVCLSADGADELFGGYTKYLVTKRLYPGLGRVRSTKARLLSLALNRLPMAIIPGLANFGLSGTKYTNRVEKLYKLKLGLANASDGMAFFDLVSTYAGEHEMKPLMDHYTPRRSNEIHVFEDRQLSTLGCADITTYLEGDILTKVDRASMAAGLEARVPFLDHQLIEFALTLPDDMKNKNRHSKYLLRKLLYQDVSQNLIDRPKQGFAIPVEKWMRNLLKAELEKMSSDKRFADCFGLNSGYLFQMIDAFIGKKGYVNAYRVWFLYVLFQWYERWIEN